MSRELKSKISNQIVVVTLVLTYISGAVPIFAQRLLPRLGRAKNENNNNFHKYKIAGLDVAVWEPEINNGPAPLVIFSHGFCGINVQSIFIMQALAKAGYLVVAPNHRDARGGPGFLKPQVKFRIPEKWSDTTYKDRADDINKLLGELHSDQKWSSQIDWSRVALSGHSLGGYTVLALGGAWPSWKVTGIKAILALSPVCEPLTVNGSFGNISVPVMFQGGTRDTAITPKIKIPNGPLNLTPSPLYFVEFDKMNHFGWTGYNKDKASQDLIDYYCVSFLDKYVKGDPNAQPDRKLPGVSELDVR